MNTEKTNELEVKYGLNPDVKFCRRCVISNQAAQLGLWSLRMMVRERRPLLFDEDGVCAACRFADLKENEIDWEEREKQLIQLCNEYRSKKGNYDCIVPGSGGKDSAFTAHVLKYKYGMNPLTVTWAPHKYTPIGWENFQNWIHSGFDNVLFTPNGKVHRLLTRLAFENLLHPFQPFIVGQRMIAPKMSVKYKIPLVFYGENQAEYGNNIEDNFSPVMKTKFFSGTPDVSTLLLGGVSGDQLVKEYGLNENELSAYLPEDISDIEKCGTVVHYLGYYLKWDPQECYYYASENTGFQANNERTEGSYSKYSSIDDRIDPLHYFTTFIKFGHRSGNIRCCPGNQK